MDLKLKNKIIIVSGGATGIGEGIVKTLAAEGAIPVIIDRNEIDNLKVVESIEFSGCKCFQVVAELTKPDACESSIQKIVKEFGEINGLVNNAGVTNSIELEHGNYEAFITTLHKNLTPYYLLAHYALPALKKSKGSIVNISFKTIETDRDNASPLVTGNRGRTALTREWALELLKYEIRVNAVIITEGWAPLHEKRINTLPITSEEIANTVAFLLSEKSSHTTGQLIHAHLDRALINA